MDFFAANPSMQFMTAFALVDLVWLVSVVVRKRTYVPVEAVCVRMRGDVAPRGGFGTRSQWLFEFEGRSHVVPKELKRGGDSRGRKVGDRAIVHVNPRNVDRSLTPQTDGHFKLFGILFLVVAVGWVLTLCI